MFKVAMGALVVGAAFMGGYASCFLTHRPEPKCIDAVYAARMSADADVLVQKALRMEESMHLLWIEAADIRVSCERGF